MLAFVGPKSIYDALHDKLNDLVVLAVVGLGSTLVSGLVKWAQDHTSSRRSAELTARISALSKTISELPDVPLSGATPNLTPRSVLTAQLESAVHELTALQAEMHVGSRFKGFSLASAIARVRSTFLLYRPQGWKAWTLHLIFYAYLFGYLFSMTAILDSKANGDDDPQKIAAIRALQAAQAPAANSTTGTLVSDVPQEVGTVPALFAFLTIFGIAAVPAVALRYFAARIHRSECEKAKAKQKSAEKASEQPPAPAAQQAG